MPFFSLSSGGSNLAYIKGEREREEFSERKRLSNLQAWNAYLDSAKDSGRKVDAEELDRYRMQLTGGNSFFMGHLPSQMMLDDIAQQNNRRAEQARIADLSKQVEDQEKVTEAARGLAGFEDDADTVRQNLIKQYGEQNGETMFRQVEPRLQELQNRNVHERAAELFESERANNVVRPEDVETFFGREHPLVKQELWKMAETKYAEHRKGIIGQAINTIRSAQDPSVFRHLSPQEREERAKQLAQEGGIYDLTEEETQHIVRAIDLQSSVSLGQRTELQRDQFRVSLGEKMAERAKEGRPITTGEILGMANLIRSQNQLPPLDLQGLERELGAPVIRWVEAQSYSLAYSAAAESARTDGEALGDQFFERWDTQLNAAAEHLINNKPDGLPRMKKDDPAYAALVMLRDQGIIPNKSTSDVAAFAASVHHEMRKQSDIVPPEAIVNAIIDEFGFRSREDIKLEYAAERMADLNFDIKPGTGVEDFVVKQIDRGFEVLEQDLARAAGGEGFEQTLANTVRKLEDAANDFSRMLEDPSRMVAFREYVQDGTTSQNINWRTYLKDEVDKMHQRIADLRTRAMEAHEEALGVQPEEVLPRRDHGLAWEGGRQDWRDMDPNAMTQEMEALAAQLENTDPYVGDGFMRRANPEYQELSNRMHQLERELQRYQRQQGTRQTPRGLRPSRGRPPAAEEPEEPEPVITEPATEAPATEAPEPVRLGSISARFEARGKPDTISTGRGDHGGVSYGQYQLSSKMGTLNRFLSSSGYFHAFSGLQPGTQEFNAKWRSMSRDPAFVESQHQFIKATHYDPVVLRLKRAGMDMTGRSQAVQEMIWSTSVQFPPSLIENALRGKDASSMSDADIINAVQDYKMIHNDRLFRSSSENVRAGTLRRVNLEREALLRLL